MTSVTHEQVTAAIQAVVEEEGPDYVYPTLDGLGCFYVYDGNASCLVGKVLYCLGADLEDLKRCDDLGIINDLVLERVGIQMSEEAQTALRYAQSAQDQRQTWGEALDRYLKHLAFMEDKV